jgi:hypothetical protein
VKWAVVDDLAMPDGGRVGREAGISEKGAEEPVRATETAPVGRTDCPPQSKDGPNEQPPTMSAPVPSIWDNPAQLGGALQTAIVVFAIGPERPY